VVVVFPVSKAVGLWLTYIVSLHEARNYSKSSTVIVINRILHGISQVGISKMK
jgi:hypothetical protein